MADLGLTPDADEDILAEVKAVTQINRVIREGLAVWDDRQVIRARLAAVEREDSPAPHRKRLTA